jgi:RNA polymerase sigma factor (sigma-70 family)
MTGHDLFLEQVTALLPALRAFGRSLCGDPARADDLVQDTVLKAWTNREQFQSGSNLKAWLFTILRNCYYSELRHRKFEIEDPDGVCAGQVAIAPRSADPGMCYGPVVRGSGRRVPGRRRHHQEPHRAGARSAGRAARR